MWQLWFFLKVKGRSENLSFWRAASLMWGSSSWHRPSSLPTVVHKSPRPGPGSAARASRWPDPEKHSIQQCSSSSPAHHIWTVTINKKARQNHKSRHGTCWAFLNQDLINAELTHVNCKLLISDNVATANSVSFRKKLEQFSAQSGKAWLEVKTRVRCPSRASRSESDSARCSRAALLPEDIRRQMWQLWQIHSSCESSCESEWVDRQCIIIFQSLELYLYLSSFFIITLYCPHVCIYSEEMFAWHICATFLSWVWVGKWQTLSMSDVSCIKHFNERLSEQIKVFTLLVQWAVVLTNHHVPDWWSDLSLAPLTKNWQRRQCIDLDQPGSRFRKNCMEQSGNHLLNYGATWICHIEQQ